MSQAQESSGRLVLTDISAALPGWSRWLHSLPPVFAPLPSLRRALRRRANGAGWPSPTVVIRAGLMFLNAALSILPRLVKRLAVALLDNVRTIPFDALDRWRGAQASILRMEQGQDPQLRARSVCVMVQFSPTGALSEMVQRQIASYRALGFAVVLVSNSPAFPEEAWQLARRDAALVVHRRNQGLDFGAWRDLVPVALAIWPDAEELLIVNDSVLGPIRPLGPVLDAMRSAGPGYFGLLESIQGGPHMQSWFTLARGQAAVADLAAFLAGLRLSRSKWKIIQRGELQMARHMREKGHRVASMFGYERLVDMALADPDQRAYLDRAIPIWMQSADPQGARQLLLRHPVNPAHHLWRVLSGPAGCPFIKTELVRRNPGGLPDVETWPDLVQPDSPCPPEMLRRHLALLGP